MSCQLRFRQIFIVPFTHPFNNVLNSQCASGKLNNNNNNNNNKSEDDDDDDNTYFGLPQVQYMNHIIIHIYDFIYDLYYMRIISFSISYTLSKLQLFSKKTMARTHNGRQGKQTIS